MARSSTTHAEKLTPKRFWARVEAIDRLADLHGSRFEGDTPAARLRRKAEAVVLPQRFNRHYLPHYFRDEGCGLHELLYLALEWAQFSATRAPRGHGKSTVGTFAYTLHQVACAPVLRAWEQGTLQASDPALFQAITEVMTEEVARRLAAGVPTCARLGLPEHWDPMVQEEMDAWLARVHLQMATDGAIPLFWDPYIQVVAVDAGTATEFTAAVRAELERNPLLRSDWGDLTPCHHQDWDRQARRPASDGDWASNGVRVRSFGMFQSLRGGKHGEWRPTLLLGDDLDSEETTRTLGQRDAQTKKITSAGAYGLDERKKRIAIVGTPVDSDCVVCRLTELDQYRQRRGEDGELVGRWVSLRTRARDDAGRILYPAKWDGPALDAEELEDEDAFGSELDDRPPRDGESPFSELHTYDRAQYEGVKLPSVLVFDPALGRRATSDLQALVHVRGPTPDGAILVDLTEGYRDPDILHLVEEINQVRAELRPDVAALETIGFQALMEILLVASGQRYGLLDDWLRVEGHEEGKDLRIRGLARLSNRGKLLWPADGSCRKGERQAKAYPKGKRDILDAIEMGVRILQEEARPARMREIRHAPRRSAFFGAGAW